MTLKNFIGHLEKHYEKTSTIFEEQSNRAFQRKFCRKNGGVNCPRCEVAEELYGLSQIHPKCYMMANELLQKIIRKKKLEKLLS